MRLAKICRLTFVAKAISRAWRNQAEAGNVGHGMDGCRASLGLEGRGRLSPRCTRDDFCCGLVQRGHGADGGVDPELFRGAFLDRRRDHAGAQRFGEQQPVAGLGARIAEHFGRIDEAGNGIAEFGLLVADAVAADHGAAGFHHLGKAARQDLLEYGQIALGRKAHVGQRRDGPSAHGVDIAQRVGGGDLAEGVRGRPPWE